MKCEKKKFPNWGIANERAIEINKENDDVVMRAYECQYCGYHHLTSKSSGEYQSKKAKKIKIANKKSKINLAREAKYWEEKLSSKYGKKRDLKF